MSYDSDTCHLGVVDGFLLFGAANVKIDKFGETGT